MSFSKFLALIFLLMATPAFATFTPQASGNYGLGGLVNSAVPTCAVPPGGISVTLSASGNVDGDYVALNSNNAGVGQTDGAQWKVPTGLYFHGCGFYVYTAAGAANRSLGFGYGTAALAAMTTPTAPTGNVRYGNATNFSTNAKGFGLPLTATLQWFPFPISFPGDAYPWARYGGAGDVFTVVVPGWVDSNP